jgi:hypothetical protein
MEAAVLYTEAAETFLKVDKTETYKMIKCAISIFCDFGRFDISGIYMYLSIYLSNSLTNYLSIYLITLSIYLSI